MDSNNLGALLSGVMSNPEMMGKLQGILSNPEAMNGIKNAISGMGAQAQPQIQSENASEQDTDAANRARLIAALKPYLSEERRDKADKLLSLLTVIQASGMLGNR